MSILDKIKQIIEKRKDKHKQKRLIKADDDNIVVEALPENEDNSGIDIKRVVENMEDPEIMAEVVENNLEEIIEQNNVRDTMKHLNDNDVVRILEENKDELKQQNKMKFAIEAIGNDYKKLKVANKNLKNLTDLELANILNDFEEETTKERKEKIEKEKIRIISRKVMEHILEFGAAWHLGELTATLKEASKVEILDLCIAVIKDYDKNENRKITSSSKTNLVVDLLKVTDINYEDKVGIVEKYVDDEMLTQEEGTTVKEAMEKERLKQEKIEKERRYGLNR